MELSKNIKKPKIFIVHGHNYYMRNEVVGLLETLHVDYTVLGEEPRSGAGIIDKIEKYSSDCTTAIILMSADDEMSLKTWAARPNVILELGYFIGRFTRDNIIVVKQKRLRYAPSDINGVTYIAYSNAGAGWRTEIIGQLAKLGFDVGSEK